MQGRCVQTSLEDDPNSFPHIPPAKWTWNRIMTWRKSYPEISINQLGNMCLTNMYPLQRDDTDWNLSLCQAVSREDFWVVLTCFGQDRLRRELGGEGSWAVGSGQWLGALFFFFVDAFRTQNIHTFMGWCSELTGHLQELVPCILYSKLMGTIVFSPDQKTVRNHRFLIPLWLGEWWM